MKQAGEITSLFLDIGGVLLSNGWDREMRRKAAEKFGLDFKEMDERHHLTYDTYAEGKLELAEYLRRVVFYTGRPISPEEFKAFMFAQSQSKPEMIDLVRGLKRRYGLKVVAVSNEGRELTAYRVKKFSLGSFVDLFVSSCFVHVRKPDPDIYRIALDTAQAGVLEAMRVACCELRGRGGAGPDDCAANRTLIARCSKAVRRTGQTDLELLEDWRAVIARQLESVRSNRRTWHYLSLSTLARPANFLRLRDAPRGEQRGAAWAPSNWDEEAS